MVLTQLIFDSNCVVLTTFSVNVKILNEYSSQSIRWFEVKGSIEHET